MAPFYGQDLTASRLKPLRGSSLLFNTAEKGAIHRIEMERSLLTAEGLILNLGQFLLRYHAIASNVHVCCFTCTISQMH